jgi:hypothetical protein
MARGRRSRAAKAWGENAGSLTRDQFMTFHADVAEARQELDDAGTSHAGVWKKADPLGVHPKVAKVCFSIEKMEDTKRRDWLRAFDQYREWFGWNAQPDIFEQRVEPAREPVSGERGKGDGDDDSAGQPAEPTPEREPLPDNVEVEADVGEETTAEATEELSGAGYTFAAGRQAALEGDAAETNPHPETSPSHPIWVRGHAQGLRDKEAAESGEAEADTDVVPLRGRRSRRADAETPAALH